MKTRKDPFLLMISFGMALCWLYAWAGFLTSAILQRIFPFPEGFAILAGATGVTLAHSGRGWRIYHILLIHVVGLALASARMVYVFAESPAPFWSTRWVSLLFASHKDLMGWLPIFLAGSWAGIFWAGGVRLGQRSTEYPRICARFDMGIAAFFLLFVIDLLLWVKAGIRVQDAGAKILPYPFLLFSLTALGRAKTGGNLSGDFLPTYRGLGVLLTSAVLLLFLGTAVTLLFLPHLTLTAHQGYAALKSAAAPLGPVLVGVLRVVLVQGCRQELDPPGLPGGEASVPMPGNDLPWWLEGLMKMAGYGLVGLGGVCLCVLMGLGLWMVLRWLVSRSEKRASVGRPKGWFRAWLVRTGVFFLLAWQKMISGRKNSRGPVQLYASLLIWGKRSGFPRLGSETPSEYALRLGPCFPSLRGEIRLIVQTFNESVYGERTHDTDQLMSARGALLHLFSPIHWPSRLRSWFMHPHRGQERL